MSYTITTFPHAPVRLFNRILIVFQNDSSPIDVDVSQTYSSDVQSIFLVLYIVEISSWTLMLFLKYPSYTNYLHLES